MGSNVKVIEGENFELNQNYMGLLTLDFNTNHILKLITFCKLILPRELCSTHWSLERQVFLS